VSSRPKTEIQPRQVASSALAACLVDAVPPLTPTQALLEAERCLYCFDAPCAQACPTQIDVPSFIRRIADGNLRGAAQTILDANPLGGMCARVCPTEDSAKARVWPSQGAMRAVSRPCAPSLARGH